MPQEVDLNINGIYKIKGSELLNLLGNLKVIQILGKDNDRITRESNMIGDILTDILKRGKL